jgi:hypothetical protein
MKILQRRRKVCPQCWSLDTRPSTRRHRLEYLLRVLLICPYRCRTCGKRFWRFALRTDRPQAKTVADSSRRDILTSSGPKPNAETTTNNASPIETQK